MIRGRTLLIFKSGVKGQCHTLHFVVKPYKHNTDWTVSAGTVKLSTHTTFDKRKTPIDFQVRGHRSRSHATLCCLTLYIGSSNLVQILLMTRWWHLSLSKSKVNVTCYSLLLNLVHVAMIQTEPFQLGPSNLVHILLMTRGWHLLILKVMGQMSRSYFHLKFSWRAYFATLALLLFKILLRVKIQYKYSGLGIPEFLKFPLTFRTFSKFYRTKEWNVLQRPVGPNVFFIGKPDTCTVDPTVFRNSVYMTKFPWNCTTWVLNFCIIINVTILPFRTCNSILLNRLANVHQPLFRYTSMVS